MNKKKEKKPKPSKNLDIPQQGEIWLVEFPKIKEFSKPFRPAVAISNNLQNEFDKLITVATLTTEDIEKIRPFEVLVKNTKETGLDYPSKILTGYSFSIYKELLIEKLGLVSPEIMEKIKKTIKITFDLGETKFGQSQIMDIQQKKLKSVIFI